MVGADTDVSTTQMTIMGVLMVICSVIPPAVMLIQHARKNRQQSETKVESKFSGQAH